jgi:iron complex outermembrane recepter protein
VTRDTATGGVLNSQVSYDNQAIARTAGVDFTVNWTAPLADMGLESIPGAVSFNVQGTWLDYYKTKQSPANFDPVIDWKGSLGPNLQGFNAGAYDYRLFTSLGYNLPSVGVSLRWRHLPAVDAAGRAQENAVRANNASVAAGGPGIILGYVPVSNVEVKSYNVFDLSGYWTINDMLSARFGVDNVLGKDPVATVQTTAYPVGTNLTTVCNGAPGCINPTAYSYPNSGLGTTNGGYYDTLGRRFYVGLKARF